MQCIRARLDSFGAAFGRPLGHLRNAFGRALEQLWGCFPAVFGPFSSAFGGQLLSWFRGYWATLQCIWACLGTALDCFWAVFGPFAMHSGVAWNSFGCLQAALRQSLQRIQVFLDSFRAAFAVNAFGRALKQLLELRAGLRQLCNGFGRQLRQKGFITQSKIRIVHAETPHK